MPGTRSLRRPAVCAIALLAIGLGGCERTGGGPRTVTERIADLLLASQAPLVGSTASYPTRTLHAETRPVLPWLGGADPGDPGAVTVPVEVEIPADGALEFGYALSPQADPALPVELSVSVRTPERHEELFRERLVADADAPGGAQWADARLDLRGWSGPATLEFRAASDRLRIQSGRGRLRPHAFFSAPVVTGRSDAKAPMKVVLVSVDTLRADRLGLYGCDRDTSPHIDRLFGRKGVVVDHFFTNAVETLGAHAAMMTGLLPETALGAAEPLRTLGPWDITLAEAFRARGFRTAAFTEDAWVSARFGFSRGFERYREERGTNWSEETRGYAEVIFDRGLRWLEAHRREDAFLFLHTYEVHAPYTPRARFLRDLPPDGAPPSAVDSARYDAEIRYLDEQFGRFFDAVQASGLLKNGVLVLVSDHGEEFGEHGRRYHGTHLYEETLAVPALFYAPGRLPAGVRRSGPVSVVDLAPTLLDLLGIAAPPDLDGASFAAHLRDGAPPPARPIYHEAQVPAAFDDAGRDDSWIAPSFGVTAWPFRLTRIRTPGGARYELYDLDADPAEKADIAGTSGARLARLRPGLDGYAEAAASRRAALARRLRHPGEPAPSRPKDLEPGISRKLRALGYLQ